MERTWRDGAAGGRASRGGCDDCVWRQHREYSAPKSDNADWSAEEDAPFPGRVSGAAASSVSVAVVDVAVAVAVSVSAAGSAASGSVVGSASASVSRTSVAIVRPAALVSYETRTVLPELLRERRAREGQLRVTERTGLGCCCAHMAPERPSSSVQLSAVLHTPLRIASCLPLMCAASIRSESHSAR